MPTGMTCLPHPPNVNYNWFEHKERPKVFSINAATQPELEVLSYRPTVAHRNTKSKAQRSKEAWLVSLKKKKKRLFVHKEQATE